MLKNLSGGGYTNEEKYPFVMGEALSLLRQQFDGTILIVYHPQKTYIKNDGTLEFKKSETLDIFEELCRQNDIGFVDITDRYVEHYEECHELPYGFANTTPGDGHMNAIGHRIVADAIINYFEEVE